MKTILFSILISLTLPLFAQQGNDLVYTTLPDDMSGSDAPEGQTPPKSGFYGNDFEYAVYSFTNVIREGQADKRQQMKMENERSQAIAKTAIIKSQYADYEKYPEKIIDGWHNVIATNSSTFCKDAKVLVKDNRIKKFVIDNCIPINFLATSEIKKAKNNLTLKNFNGQELNIFEVFFIYDIDEQQLVEEPIKAGILCFWSDLKKFDQVFIKVDGEPWNKFTMKCETIPDCSGKGTVSRILKPGKYQLKAVGRGAIDWESTLEVKSGKCLRVRLGRQHYN